MAPAHRGLCACAVLLLSACSTPRGAADPPAKPVAATAPAAPPAATTVPPVRSIAVGRAHTCAVLADGSVRCWGENGFGQLGDGTQRTRPTPVRVKLPPVRAVEADDDHTCAITESGEVYCWGLVYGEWPELERGQGFATVPTRVEGLADVRELALGKVYAAALIGEGSLVHWGGETRSMAPDRDLDARRTPAKSRLTGRYHHVGMGRSLLCAATNTTVDCAKLYITKDDDLDYDCVGTASVEAGCAPFSLPFERAQGVSLTKLDPTSQDHDPFRDDAICAVGEDGAFACASRVRDQASSEGGRWGPLESLRAPPIRSARGSLALGRGGELFSATFHHNTLCSEGGCKLRRLPIDELTRDASLVALGTGHSCVVRQADILCWGDNASGQLGNGTRSAAAQPQRVKLDAVEAVETTVDLRARYAALHAKHPAKEKLGGFALVLANSELFAAVTDRESRGRLASMDDELMLEHGEPRYLVAVTEDRGDRVGVRLVTGPAERHCGAGPRPQVALRGFVRRDALTPVVKKRTRVAFDDEWIDLLPGTPVFDGPDGRSALVFGERVPIEVPDGSIGFSYTLGQQRKLENEGALSITVGGRLFKKKRGSDTTESEASGDGDEGIERMRVFHACTNALARDASFDSTPVPVEEEREYGFGWVDEGNAAYYPNGKRAGDLTGVLHLRADKLTDRGSRRCFRAVGEVELCFDRTAVNEARTE